jgi:putative tricarboxylic transport membrane protein
MKGTRMGVSEIVFGSIFLFLSMFFFALTFQFPEVTIALSPTVFPRFVTVSLGFLSLLLLAQGIRKRLGSRGEKHKVRVDRPYAIRFLLLASIAFVYTRILETTGYLLATPLFIAGAMLVFNEKKWHRIALISILTTAVLYGVFRMIFRVPLPRFPLW